MAYNHVHPEVIDAINSGILTGLEELITSRIGIEDTVPQGFEKLLTEKDSQVKILIHP
jgi:(R,R)-butanediol dehydrogenase/meso-butanediol dehydrogenase/diacetyl reductase